MTAPLIVIVVFMISTLGAHLANAAVRLTLTRWALRDSNPGERAAILEALAPALHAIGQPHA